MKTIATLGLLYFALLFPAFGIQITVDWPSDALGNYSISGITPAPSTAKATYEIPEGANARLQGDGFAVNFSVKYGKVQFPFSTGSAFDSVGVRFDSATNTFSFITVDLHVVKKDYEGPVGIDADANAPSSPDGSYKVVYGMHSISCPDRLSFRVDSHGVILLMNTTTGVTSRGSTLFLEGLPLEVTPAGSAQWTLDAGLPAEKKTGPATIHLVPTGRGYTFLSTARSSFFLNDDGLVALNQEGPYAEFITLPDGTKIGIPDGEAKYAARVAQEQADADLRQKVLAASASATWKQDFNLVEKMKLCDFPEEQLSYLVTLPTGADPKELTLLEFTEKSVRVIPFQLSPAGDSAAARTIYFRSDLPLGGSRLFRLVRNYDTAGIPALTPQAPTIQPTTVNPLGTVVFSNGLVSVEVPGGHHDFSPPQPLAQVPAPILRIARGTNPGTWAATGSFVAPDSLLVASMDAQVQQQGPLFLTYKVTYHLANGDDYAVELEQRAGDAEMRVSETLHGLKPEDQAFFRLDYSTGLNPDRRLVPSNGGYDLYGGAYDRDASTDGSKEMWPVTTGWLNYDPKLDSSPVPELNFRIGLYSPNNLNVVRTACFYNETGADALLLTAMRLRDWQVPYREVWTSYRGPENFRFYADGAKKYCQAGLCGTQRFWAVSLIPRDDVTLRGRPGVGREARGVTVGPEVWLNSKLTAWSLNAYKDRAVDWDEKLDAAPFDHLSDSQSPDPYKAMSYDDYVKSDLATGLMWIANFQENLGGGLWTRDSPRCFADYALSRASWTPEQRQQIRQILVFLADFCESDDRQLHHSMLSGHPNFVMETKMILPIAAATFPNHPEAKMWRDSFMQFFQEFLDQYGRKDVPELNTVGGRWTENIACYVGACYFYMLDAQEALQAYDGSSIGKNPQMFALVHWMRDAMMSPHDGQRMFPPEGAHSQACEPGMPMWNCYFALCQNLGADDPQFAQESKWMETNGAQGTKPDIHSKLFTDYGPVFHYDFGGPHESYAHMQIINGISYRWGHAGIVYYGAKNKIWSYNGSETNGDGFDWNAISAFNVNDVGLRPGPTDQLLYDFDFAQFYRHVGGADDDYQARGLMLLRDDYLVLSDEVKSADVAGTFNWVSLLGLPQIYQLKPGAPQTERPAQQFDVPRPKTEKIAHKTGKILSYSGKGDFLTVVAPMAVQAEAKPFGAMVNGEYVFASRTTETITDGPAQFSGNYGYARANQLALFQGTSIGLNGFSLRRDGGDFGVSGSVEGDHITGRLVGRSGGKIYVTPPGSPDLSKAAVTVNGQPVVSSVESGAIVFTVDIAQKDGLKNYEITGLPAK